jgi:hypothetical protein
MHWAFSVQSTFLDNSDLPHSALKLRHTEAINKLYLTAGAQLEATPEGQFSENHDTVVSQPVRQQTGAHDSVPDLSNPEADTEVVLIPTFANSMRFTPCAEVTVVDVEHTLMLRLSTECYVNRAHPQ